MNNQKILYFTIKSCAPCKVQWPGAERVANSLGIHIEKVDIEHNYSDAKSFSILMAPTMIFLDNGQEVGRHVGTIDDRMLTDLLKQAYNL